MADSPVSVRENFPAALLVLLAASLLAFLGAMDCVGGWNDSSRLATVECLVDHHTLAIDRSIYVDVPGESEIPDPRLRRGLLPGGTLDKLLIAGHFYSDKSPVPALLMAGSYQVQEWLTGQTARDRPDRFVYWMTLGSSGVAFVVAVWCIFRLGLALALSLPLRLALTASFGLATVAPAYACQVNNHAPLLAVAALLALGLVRLGQQTSLGRASWWVLALLGSAAGLGYTIDLGAGPMLFLCTAALVAYRGRSLRAVLLFGLAALPWLVLHHAVNYATGGTFQPANAVPEYLLWPGSPFTAQTMTGGWRHANLLHFVSYALDMLVGKRGLFGHNLPLFLAIPGVVVLIRRRPAELPELLWATATFGSIWLVYAANSNNMAGLCLSVRWLVPLLAPGYLVLALLVRDCPSFRPSFFILTGWGMVLAAIMVVKGPWTMHMVPGYWLIYGAVLASWIGYHLWHRRRARQDLEPVTHSRWRLPAPHPLPGGLASSYDVRR